MRQYRKVEGGDEVFKGYSTHSSTLSRTDQGDGDGAVLSRSQHDGRTNVVQTKSARSLHFVATSLCYD